MAQLPLSGRLSGPVLITGDYERDSIFRFNGAAQGSSRIEIQYISFVTVLSVTVALLHAVSKFSLSPPYPFSVPSM